MRDLRDRDRQQRELTEELRHDADLRAARKRLEEERQRPAPWDQPLSINEARDWAADVATQTTGDDVTAPPARRR